jgi:hypothetical protein
VIKKTGYFTKPVPYELAKEAFSSKTKYAGMFPSGHACLSHETISGAFRVQGLLERNCD